MALINCPDCGKQISSSAVSCLGCGAPIAAAREVRATGAPLTTVQETSKRLKIHMLISAVAISVGVIMMIAAFQNAGDGVPETGLAIVLIFAGLIWYLVSRIRVWWHHK